MSQKLLIQAEYLHRYYDQYHAVNNISITLYQGEVLGLLGQNGGVSQPRCKC